MINNRQAGRRRGRGGQQQRSQGNPGRQDNGNRIDNRARGNAAQLLEKYKSLARDAQMQGDRVNTEYYLQFADHYFRVLAETRARFEENRQQNGGPAYQDDEQEYDEDGEPVARPERPAQQASQPQQGRQDQSPRRDQNEGDRDEQPRRFNGNNGYDQGDRQSRAPRQDYGNARQDGGRDEARADRYGSEGPAGVEGELVSEAPRRRGRPRREENTAPNGFDAGILPPALGIPAAASNDDGEGESAEKPRRRRTRLAAPETPVAE